MNDELKNPELDFVYMFKQLKFLLINVIKQAYI